MYLFKTLEFDKALIYLEKMIALPPRKGRWRRAKLVANKARALYALGRIDEALGAQREAMKIFFSKP